MTLSKRYRRLKNAGHLLFWLASLGFALSAFYVVSEHQLGLTPDIMLRALIINLGFAVAVYTNFYLLIPRLLKKKNYIFYVFWLIITLSASSLIIISLFFLLNQQAFSKHLFSTHFFTSAAYVAITSLAKFVTDWIELQDISLRYHKVEREKLEAELNTLKSQINPHFLFNSLNNIYSLSLMNSDKTPQLILKLSDLMRHVLYESRENFIPLKREIEFVRNFIELQRIRLNEKTDIRFNLKGDISNQKIIPLIFEPFIDNAFKHGPRSFSEQAFIHIFITIEGKQLLFEVENSCDCQEPEKQGTAHGIGLANVRQRLAYLYKNEEYDLDISKKANIFTVRLKLMLK
ncbi:sensor histidine kinase [Gaoshiqia sediminis]|uniref:Histidine kinase n=1 Tax=Gaoshiqia sediminis TaxID=2986998 RepID=A0AA41Y3G0_9BACT|nr:histidine kinase [Gaoshiqia sediminis]MCW0482751.1 histidine kinase [Gaoshiqia sediminis]